VDICFLVIFTHHVSKEGAASHDMSKVNEVRHIVPVGEDISIYVVDNETLQLDIKDNWKLRLLPRSSLGPNISSVSSSPLLYQKETPKVSQCTGDDGYLTKSYGYDAFHDAFNCLLPLFRVTQCLCSSSNSRRPSNTRSPIDPYRSIDRRWSKGGRSGDRIFHFHIVAFNFLIDNFTRDFLGSISSWGRDV